MELSDEQKAMALAINSYLLTQDPATREAKIRMLAAQILSTSDVVALQLSQSLLAQTAKRALREAAQLIDAVDALPVPAKEKP